MVHRLLKNQQLHLKPLLLYYRKECWLFSALIGLISSLNVFTYSLFWQLVCIWMQLVYVKSFIYSCVIVWQCWCCLSFVVKKSSKFCLKKKKKFFNCHICPSCACLFPGVVREFTLTDGNIPAWVRTPIYPPVLYTHWRFHFDINAIRWLCGSRGGTWVEVLLRCFYNGDNAAISTWAV